MSAITTEITWEACRRHELRGAEAIVLGRALTAGCLLATLTKHDDERVRIHVNSDGPLGRVLVDARGDGGVRGCFTHRPSWLERARQVDGRDSVAHLVGQVGHIVITRDLGFDQEYQGVTRMSTGEIDTDIEAYLDESEQLPSVLACEVVLDAHDHVVRAAGVLCQTFPEADRERLEALRDNLHSGAFASLLQREREPEELMGFALLGDGFKAMPGTSLVFRCQCGRERALSVLSTLGADDLERLADEQSETEVKCTYCGRAWVLERGDLLDLAELLRQRRS